MSRLAERLARLHGRPTTGPAAPSTETVPVGSRASLTERIARLRLRAAAIGALAPSDADLAARVGGRVVAPMLIEVSSRHPFPLRHGRARIESADEVAEGVRVSARLPSLPDPGTLLCLDTETTGLAGGSGTLAFVVGLASVQPEAIEVEQLLLTGFGGEGALLDCLAARLERAAHLLTFNGKSFDLPLLRARARLAGRTLMRHEPAHLDLLHVTRRRLRENWRDCRLRTTEEEALGFHREDDLPGADVPVAWQRWLRRGDASLLGRVLDHNREDLLSLPALLAILAWPTPREAPLLRGAPVE